MQAPASSQNLPPPFAPLRTLKLHAGNMKCGVDKEAEQHGFCICTEGQGLSFNQL